MRKNYLFKVYERIQSRIIYFKQLCSKWNKKRMQLSVYVLQNLQTCQVSRKYRRGWTDFSKIEKKKHYLKCKKVFEKRFLQLVTNGNIKCTPEWFIPAPCDLIITSSLNFHKELDIYK